MITATANEPAPRNLDALLAAAVRPPSDSSAPSVVRLSRIEAILASVLEHGLAATEHTVRSGEVFKLAA